jgi:hypothetical protein
VTSHQGAQRIMIFVIAVEHVAYRYIRVYSIDGLLARLPESVQ